jgi:hypothetical protein
LFTPIVGAAAGLVGQAEDFDCRHQPSALAHVEDPNLALRWPFEDARNDNGYIDLGQLLNRCRAGGRRFAGRAGSWPFDNPHVGDVQVIVRLVFDLNRNVFLNSHLEVSWHLQRKLVTGICHEARVDVSPVRLKIRVHPRKWALHRRLSRSRQTNLLHCNAPQSAALRLLHLRLPRKFTDDAFAGASS